MTTGGENGQARFLLYRNVVFKILNYSNFTWQGSLPDYQVNTTEENNMDLTDAKETSNDEEAEKGNSERECIVGLNWFLSIALRITTAHNFLRH